MTARFDHFLLYFPCPPTQLHSFTVALIGYRKLKVSWKLHIVPCTEFNCNNSKTLCYKSMLLDKNFGFKLWPDMKYQILVTPKSYSRVDKIKAHCISCCRLHECYSTWLNYMHRSNLLIWDEGSLPTLHFANKEGSSSCQILSYCRANTYGEKN